MTTISRKKLLAGAVSLFSSTLLLASQNTFAEPIEEVLITAQKREQSLQDVGISVTAFDANFIKESGISTPADVADFTPNMVIRNTIGDTMPVIAIRGVGISANDIVFPTSSPSSALHVDEVYLGSPAMMSFSAFDVQRIEVLKGPQGTLYGRNTTAGTVNFISNKPQEEFAGNIKTGYDSFNVFTTEGFVTGALSDSINGRLAYTYKKGDHYIEDLSGDAYDGPDLFAIKGLLDFELSDNVSLLLNVHGGKDQSGIYHPHILGILDAPGETCPFENTGKQDVVRCVGTLGNQLNDDPHKNDGNFSENFDIKNFGTSANLTWDISDTLTLTSITAFESVDSFKPEELDGQSVERLMEFTFDDEIDQFTQELRLSSSTDDLFWVIGAYYYNEELTTDKGGDFFDMGNLPGHRGSEYHSEQDTTSWALFGQSEWSLSDKLKLTLGLRYTVEEKDFDPQVNYDRDRGFDVFDPSLGVIDPGTGMPVGRWVRQFTGKASEEWDDVSGKIGLDYQLSDDLLIFGSISKGFKGGTYNGSLLVTPLDYDKPADPETLWSLEAGIKSMLLEDRLRLNASVWKYQYEDLQVNSLVRIGVDNVNFLENAAEVAVQGLDLDLLWVPADGLDIYLGVGYTDGEYEKFESDVGAGLTDRSGQAIPNAPELSVTGRARYEWALSEGVMAVSLDATWTDDIEFDFREERSFLGKQVIRQMRSDDYTLVNARISWSNSSENLELSLWGKNLTDEEVVSHITLGADDLAAYYKPPRSYGVSISYGF